jgi:von Willebrand factor
MGCKLGEEYVVPEGECCGDCVKTKCVFEGNVTIDVG